MQPCRAALLLSVLALGGCGIADAYCSAVTLGLADGCDISDDGGGSGGARIDGIDAFGRLSVFSDASHGGGVALQRAFRIVVDEARGRAVVSDIVAGNLVAVDLASQDRTVLASDTVWARPKLDGVLNLAFDAAGDRLLVAATKPAGLYVVDAATGDHMLVSGPSLGDGPPFEGGDVAWDPAAGRAVIAASGAQELHAIDPATGDREILSGDARGSGPSFSSLRGIVIDPARDVAYVADVGLDVIFAVELTTGDRTIIAGAGVGAGPGLGNSQSFALGADHDTCYALDWESDRVLRIDLTTGDRLVFASEGLGGRTPYGIALWEGGDLLLVAR
jgi:DNA-binding beta-propeller fold protein YncE